MGPNGCTGAPDGLTPNLPNADPVAGIREKSRGEATGSFQHAQTPTAAVNPAVIVRRRSKGVHHLADGEAKSGGLTCQGVSTAAARMPSPRFSVRHRSSP